jgi:hypothetical protein
MYQQTRTTEIAKGIIVANLMALAIMGITNVLVNDETGSAGSLLIFSEFVIIPLLMGIVTAWYWRNYILSGWDITGYSVITTLTAIAFSFIFLKEGAICLIIVSPLIWGFVLAGAFIGREMFKKNDHTINVSIVSLLMVIFIADALSEHRHQNLVSDEIVINAPANKVWKHVVAFEKIKQKNNYWLFKQTTVGGYYKGAGRKCIFSNGYVFDERIMTYQPGKDLTFDIVHQPRDPEIMGHIDILRGQFLLKDNGNGTTTVTGNSWYKLYVFPTWYYDLWAESIVRNVHIRVMEHIKELSERK